MDNCLFWTINHIPSMNNNGFIPSPSLNHAHLVNDINKCLGIGTQTLSTPLLQLELSHLLNLTRLMIDYVCE